MHADTPSTPVEAPLGSPERPTWRGRLHLIGLCAAIPLLVVLAIESNGARSRAGVIVYAVGLCSMLAVSTTYHRWVHTRSARAAWRRADHATIFAAIGGTGTALALTTLGTGWAVGLLIVIWFAAVVGAVVKIVSFDRAARLGTAPYVLLGWSGVAMLPSMWQRAGPAVVMLFVAGGVVYTLGAVGFRKRWPTLRPAAFSYHEVWHAFTIVAAGLHLAAIRSLAT